MKFFLYVALCAILLAACSQDKPNSPSLGSIAGRTIDARTLRMLGSVQISTVPPSITILTDSTGSYSIDNVVPGTYVVSGRYLDSAQGTATVNVLANHVAQADLVLSFGSGSTGSIVGRVTDESGAGVRSASVSSTPPTSSVTTDDNGSFVIAQAAPGDYVLSARSGFLYGETAINVAIGSTSSADITVRAQDPSKGWVLGQITRNGNPEAGVLIRLTGTPTRDTTDSGGNFYLANVAPGARTLSIEDSFGAEYVRIVTVVANVGTSISIDIGFPSTAPAAGLIAYYPLNDNGSDLGPNRYDGEVFGATFVADRFNRLGKAVRTTGSINDGVIVPHHPAMNSFPLTLSAWIRIDDPLLMDCLVLGKNIHPSGNGYYLMIENQELVFVYIQDGFSKGYRVDLVATAFEWVHVAMVVNDTEGIVYVNGTAFPMDHYGSAMGVTTTGEFRMGSHQTSSPGFAGFNGAIDDVFIYNRVLSPAEISLLKEVKF